MNPTSKCSHDNVGAVNVIHRRVKQVATPQKRQSQPHVISQNNGGKPSVGDVSAHTHEFSCSNNALGVKLDKNLFRHFWPLLDDCRDYARLRGCRFRSRSWDGLSGDVTRRSQTRRTTSGNAAVARARHEAAPTVYRFADRLRAGEVELLDELDRASRIVSVESVRRAMIATSQRLELWPPSSSETNVSEDDCRFEDMSVPLPVIAQRLYNDETRRASLSIGNDEPDFIQRRAMMAIFITEFGTAVGVTQSETAKTYEGILSDFMAKAAEWEQQRDSQHGHTDTTMMHDDRSLYGLEDASLAGKVMSVLVAVPKLILSIDRLGKA